MVARPPPVKKQVMRQLTYKKANTVKDTDGVRRSHTDLTAAAPASATAKAIRANKEPNAKRRSGTTSDTGERKALKELKISANDQRENHKHGGERKRKKGDRRQHKERHVKPEHPKNKGLGERGRADRERHNRAAVAKRPNIHATLLLEHKEQTT